MKPKVTKTLGYIKRCYGIATLIAENQKANLLNWRV